MSASAAPAGLPAGTATFLAPLQPAVLAAAFAQPGAEVQAVQATGSTNSDLVRRARETAPSAPWLRCALEQTAGRGRLGRRWYAAPGSAFLFSVALPLARETPPVGVTLAVGLALAERLQCLTEALGVVLGPDAWQLKWPNDVLLATPAGRAKLGGVLAELAVDRRGRRSLVVGVGLNLWLDPSARGSIGQAAAALADVLPLAQLAPLRERWLGELAGAVVGAVREVQAGRGEGQALLVGLDPHSAASGEHGPRQVGLDQQAHPGGGVAFRQGLGEGAVAGAEVDGAGEVAHDGFQAHHDVACGAAFQEVGPGIARGGPVQPPAQEVAVEDSRGRSGGRHAPGQ